jgi:arylsulfatase A-like enzyme
VGSDQSGPDSQNLLEVFLGQSDQGREELILEATTRTALRKGDWVLIPPYEGPALNKWVNIEVGNLPEYGLYNLKADIGQQENLATERPDKLREMIATYAEIRGEGAGNIQQLELK